MSFKALNCKYEFTESPAEPLKNHGESWSTGWDIPTLWAVDADNQCWANDAHGGDLTKVIPQKLLAEVENFSVRSDIRKILGMKPELPSWVRAAKQAGWTPPADWNEGEYEG